MEQQLTRPVSTLAPDAPPDAGSNLAETEQQIRRLADASDAAIGDALQNIDVSQFLELSRHLTGGQ